MRRSKDERTASFGSAWENGGETENAGSPMTCTRCSGAAASGVSAYAWTWKDRSTSNPAQTTGSVFRASSIASLSFVRSLYTKIRECRRKI